MPEFHSVSAGDMIPATVVSTCCASYALPGGIVFATASLKKIQVLASTTNDAHLVTAFLTVDEQERYQRFPYRKRQSQWLAGRIAAKAAVEKYRNKGRLPANIDWQAWQVVADEHGKPHIIPSSDSHGMTVPEISLSHSGDLAIAMAAPYPCGIDIQKTTATVTRVQRRFCSADEKKVLQESSFLKKQNEVTRLTLLWAAKEAVRKAVAISPLLGFKEIALHAVVNETAGNVMMTLNANRPGVAPGTLMVCAMLYQDFAVAFTLSATNEDRVA